MTRRCYLSCTILKKKKKILKKSLAKISLAYQSEQNEQFKFLEGDIISEIIFKMRVNDIFMRLFLLFFGSIEIHIFPGQNLSNQIQIKNLNRSN